MSDVYVGQILTVGFNFTMLNYALCNGQTLPIQQYTTLFSLLGTTYGGNGTSNFRLPELRGRAPIHYGQRPGGSFFNLGQAGGTETVTLTTAQLPPHTHSAQASGSGGLTVSNADGTADPSSSAYLAKQAGSGLQGQKIYTTDSSSTTAINGLDLSGLGITIGNTGNGQAVDTLSPYLAINFQIALEGLYPSRN